MSKTKGSPQPAQGDEMQREQWWEGEDNKRKSSPFLRYGHDTPATLQATMVPLPPIASP